MTELITVCVLSKMKHQQTFFLYFSLSTDNCYLSETKCGVEHNCILSCQVQPMAKGLRGLLKENEDDSVFCCCLVLIVLIQFVATFRPYYVHIS